MDEVYNWGYYMSHCGENYENSEVWQEFFEHLAGRIIDELNPKTVLDVGCATGYLVAALRDKGVEAWGIDVSQAAIDHGRPDIRTYLQVHSLLDDDKPGGMPEHYDLVTNIEVLEHLYEEEAEHALSNLCSFSNHILFSSAPDDLEEKTHVNVRLPEYWVKMFAKQGFYRSTSYEPPAVLPYGTLFTKNEEMTVPRLVEDYERFIRQLKDERPYVRRPYTATVMFDYGNGFTTEGMLEKQNTKDEFDWTFQVPAGVKQLQFTAASNLHSVLEDLRVAVAGQAVPAYNIHGDEVPRVQPLISPGEPVRAEVAIPGVPLPNRVQVTAQIHIIEAEEYLITALANLQKSLNGQKAEVHRLQVEEHKHQHLIADHTNLLGLYESTKVSYLDYKELYEATIRSSSWRITKPFRGVSRGVKGLVRRACLSLPGLRKAYPYLAACHMFGRDTVKYNLKHYGTLEGSKSPFVPTMKDALEQEQMRFSPAIKFSIACPLYNTPENFLRQMIQSVVGQTYGDWELCLADGSDAEHGYVERVVREFQRKDSRIVYKRLAKNDGIAGNTNAAIDMATGEYIGLLDHDDILNINALFEVRRAIAEKSADFVFSDECTFDEDFLDRVIVFHFKPDFAPDNLRANNYICHFSVFKKSLLAEAGGGFRSEYDGSQDYDMVLRLTEKAKCVAHVQKLLYFWRSHGGSVASNISVKPYAVTSAINAISAHLERAGLKGEVTVAPGFESIYKIDYEIEDTPLISIIIPSRDEADTLKNCIDSIFEKSTYKNIEIIIAENNSRESATFQYYEGLEKDDRVQVVKWNNEFNFSAINNYAAGFAKGQYLLFLNNDTEVITENWLEEMLMFAQRGDVGAVGAKLYFPDDTVQHAGLVLGMAEAAGHSQAGEGRDKLGYMGTLKYTRNVSAVTGACMMMRRDVFEQVEGFNEKFVVAMNDVDLCLRLRKAGYLIVFTPFAELYHFESKSRGEDMTQENKARLKGEVNRLHALWGVEIHDGDPYYNRNFDLDVLEIKLALKD